MLLDPPLFSMRQASVPSAASCLLLLNLVFLVLLLLSLRRPAPQSRPHMLMQPLWCTAVTRTHIRTHPAVRNVTAFNARLEARILTDHATFVDWRKRTREARRADEAWNEDEEEEDENDAFFEMQCGSKQDLSGKNVSQRVKSLQHRRTHEFYILSRMARTVARRATGKENGRVQAWATVLRSGERHVRHVHEGAQLTVVYYVRAGSGGRLRLLDGRGERFGGGWDVEVAEGEIVAFPGWVPHEVLPGDGVGVRVSVVFNVLGAWDVDLGQAVWGEVRELGRWGGKEDVGSWSLDWEQEVDQQDIDQQDIDQQDIDQQAVDQGKVEL